MLGPEYRTAAIWMHMGEHSAKWNVSTYGKLVCERQTYGMPSHMLKDCDSAINWHHGCFGQQAVNRQMSHARGLRLTDVHAQRGNIL